MKIVLVSENISPKMERTLRLFGYEPFLLPSLDLLPKAIRSHPDTLIFRHEDTLVTSADYCERAGYVFSDIREWTDIIIKVSSDEPGDKYPDDCIYNALATDKYLFCRRAGVSQAILSLAEERGLTVVNVKQGYPACSACAYNGTMISSDEGLLLAAQGVGLRTFKIQAGHISLPPYEYGFIGGASGIADGRLYFFGDYKAHPSASVIEDGARSMGLEPVSLSDEPLADLGGMIFL